MVSESWFSSLWRTSRKNVNEVQRPVIGILAFEVVSLMAKLVSLWSGLREPQFFGMREEITNSFGIKMLVSEDDDFLMSLVFAEMMENLGFVASSVARLGRRCEDSVYHHLEHLFSTPVMNDVEWGAWAYKWKQMERKVKKMEKFITVTGQLYHELDVLSELEQTFRRMQGTVDLDQVKLLEFQQKVLWQRQEVRMLNDMSPWNKTYDYIVSLLSRSVLTILERVKIVYGINQFPFIDKMDDSEHMRSTSLPRSLSVSAPMPSLVYTLETSSSRFYSGPLRRSFSKSRHIGDKITSCERRQAKHQLPTPRKFPHMKSKHLAGVGPFKGCMLGGSASPILRSCKLTTDSMSSSSIHLRSFSKVNNSIAGSPSCSNRFDTQLSLLNSKCKLLKAPQSTLGDSGLSLHYANIIILIEKLASSPQFIGLDTIDDLYNMLPTTLRTAMRARLKSCIRSLGSYIFDAPLATEWSLTLGRILEWLAPLAHNMIRWQSERNFEKQNIASRTNVLLVQTIYFADRAKTEAAITEILVVLNYVWRYGRELNEKAIVESAGRRAYQEHFAA